MKSYKMASYTNQSYLFGIFCIFFIISSGNDKNYFNFWTVFFIYNILLKLKIIIECYIVFIVYRLKKVGLLNRYHSNSQMKLYCLFEYFKNSIVIILCESLFQKKKPFMWIIVSCLVNSWAQIILDINYILQREVTIHMYYI